ncbi:MAG: nuclear transport factor 2 family protein [Gammaproteobacteria bacterium]|nr:nuclear transport factor 2 family protein [Gammaproteobacteria bacterium]
MRIESLEQIRSLKAHYCDLCDEGYDADALTALFTADALWDGGDLGQFQGHERIHRFFSNMPKVMSFAVHHITNSAIQLSEDGLRADARWYLLQTATVRVSERAVWLAGRYDDVLVREADTWKFQSVKIQTRFFTPHDEGWATTPLLEL